MEVPSISDPPPAGTKARRTHDALLGAVERLLGRGGYPAATTTAVAAEAGVSAGTFYRYFDDREDALAALFDRRLGELLEAVAAVLTADALLDDGLAAVLRRALDVTVGEYRDHAPTFRAALTQLPSSPAIREVYWRRYAETEAVLVTFLRRAQAAGSVRDADPAVLAATLLVVVQGANTPVLLARPRSRRTRAVLDELHRLLVAVASPEAG